jgi:hypothetical protein
MNAEKKAPPGGELGAHAKRNIVTLPTAAKTGNGKTSRTRFMRLFPERVLYVIEMLTPPEMVAWMRLSLAYVMRDGVLPADDKALAHITRRGTRWPALRDKLLMLGLGRIEGGLWVDDDQARNLEIQRLGSERGRTGANARWGKDHA